MHHSTPLRVVALAALSLAALTARAGPIVNALGPSEYHCTCLEFNGMGQSFTAEDPFVTIGMQAGDANVHLSPILGMTLALHDGDGTGGPVLASFDFSPTPNDFTLHWFDFDISGIAPLTVGNVYTLTLTALGGRGLAARTASDTYAGGHAYLGDGTPWAGDLGFRVLPTAAPVPEPVSIALLGVGLAGLGLRKRRS